MADDKEYQYFKNKLPSRTYVSKRIERKSFDGSESKNIRAVSKVFDIPEFKEYIKEKKQIVLRRTESERQEVKAWVEEKTRDFSLSIQRFQVESGVPVKNTSVSFSKAGLERLFDFVQSLGYLDFSNPSGKKIEDSEMTQLRRIIAKYADDPELAALLATVSKSDVASVTYRRSQLDVFSSLLRDPAFFAQKKKEWNKHQDELVWQEFFQRNQWVFGYGLNYVFNAAVEKERLQQSVRGADVGGSGKTVDALLKSRGFIHSLVLVEIKRHTTLLLKAVKDAYRADAWQISDELNGGIAQSHKNVEETMRNTRVTPVLNIKAEDGTPTGEAIYSYKPKSYLIVGSLHEFMSEHGVNVDQYSSFELFRKSLLAPEIITFDELFERAKYIVEHNEADVARIGDDNQVIASTVELPDDIPF